MVTPTARGPDGQRVAWNGYDWVPVSDEFDPSGNAFMAGLERTGEALQLGGRQALAAMTGDEEALRDAAEKNRLSMNEADIAGQYGSPTFALGRMAPYVAAPVAAQAVLPAGAATTVGAIGADVALGGMEYGTLGERAVGAAMGATGPAAALGLRGAARGMGLLPQRSRAARVQQRVARGDAPLTSPTAGGTAFPPSPEEITLGQRAAFAIRRLAGETRDPQAIARKQRVIDIADRQGIRLSIGQREQSKAIQQYEASLMSYPRSLGPGNRVLNEYKDRLERATSDFLLPNDGGQLDRSWLSRAWEDVRLAYQEREAASTGILLDADEITEAARRALRGKTRAWDEKDRELFERIVRDFKSQHGEELSGPQAWNVYQQYAERAARDFDKKYEAGQARQAVADAIKNQIINESPVLDRQAINLLDKRYRVLTALDNAGAITDDGLSMRKAANAMMRNMEEYRTGNRFEGAEHATLNDFLDVLDVGDGLFRGVVGDSGTATRLKASDLDPRSLAHDMARGVAARIHYGEPIVFGRGALRDMILD